MTIRFAAAQGSPTSLTHRFGTTIAAPPANDDASSAASDAVLRAALRHFAQTGLGAADVARQNAEKAFFCGDRETYDHWLAICRLLDARMASAIAARQYSPRLEA